MAAKVALIWGVTWAVLTVLFGVLLETFTGFSLEKHIDPMAAVAFPGSIFGLMFYTFVTLFEREKSLVEIPLSKLVLMGAGVGFICGALALTMGTPNPNYPFWKIGVTMVVSTTSLSSISAFLSGVVMRKID